MDELLFNMHETLPESEFPISTVRMKATSRHTTYPRMSMIQRWKREKSAGNQNCPTGVFPFLFQESSEDDFCQHDCGLSNPSGHLIEEWEKNHISKTQHDPTVDSKDMATGALLVFFKFCTSLSSWIFYIVSLFFWTGGLFAVYRHIFP